MVSFSSTNKKKKKKQWSNKYNAENTITTPSPCSYRDNFISFSQNGIQGAFGTLFLATSVGYPCHRQGQETCAYPTLFP